jgi:hypothetical protein
MHALPKGLWDSTVSFEAEMTNTEDGILWIIKAPLGLVQRTTWRCLKTALTGTVKGKCEENWRGAHEKFIGHLKDGAKA